MHKTCETCRCAFNRVGPAKYCSLECRTIARRREPHLFLCPVCLTIFSGKRGRLFCSSKCRDRHKAKIYHPSTDIVVNCIRCGEAVKKTRKDRKYCSLYCAYRSRSDYQKEYYLKNKDKITVRSARVYARNRETRRVSHRLWNIEDNYVQKTRSVILRLKKLGLDTPVELTREEWVQIKSKYKGKCYYCGQLCPHPTFEHVIPLARGGRHSAANVVPSCLPCNLRKGRKTEDEFKSFLERYARA